LLCLQFFELQFQLLDVSADLLALGTKDHPPQLGDDQLQVLDLVVTAEKLVLLRSKRFILGEHFLLLRGYKCLKDASVQRTQFSRCRVKRGHRSEYATDGAEL